MKRIARLLFGYRDDLDLSSRWWHRLAKVGLFASIPILWWKWTVFLTEWLIEHTSGPWNSTARMMAEYRGQVWERPSIIYLAYETGSEWFGLLLAALTLIVAVNLYYRVLVYIICGGGRLIGQKTQLR